MPNVAGPSSSPVMIRLSVPGSPSRDVAFGGGDEGGDAALHVGRAAPGQPAALDARFERLPPRPGGDDVGVAGEGEVRRAGADGGEQVGDRAVGRGAVVEAVDGEADMVERRRQHVLRTAVERGDAGAGDQPGGEVEGVDHGLA